MKLMRLFLFLLVPMVMVGCVEMDTGFFRKTSKPAEPLVEEPAVEPVAVQKRFEKVTASRLNLRESPSSKARILAVLKEHESVEILTENKRWVEVRSETGQQGWVASSYLSGFETEATESKKPIAAVKAETATSQTNNEGTLGNKRKKVVPSQPEESGAEPKAETAAKVAETEPTASQTELNILGIIPGMDFQQACTIAEQIYSKHKPFFDMGDEGFYDKRVFQEAGDPYGYYDSWCGIFRKTGDRVEIDETGGMLLKKQYGKLVYLAMSSDVVDELFNAVEMDDAALVKVLEKDYNITPWEQVDMVDSQTKKVSYTLYECKIGPTGEHLSITLGPQKFLEVDDFRVEALVKKVAPREINVQLTNPGDSLEKELVDIANDFRRALEEGDFATFDKHIPADAKTDPEEFVQLRGILLEMIPDFTNAKGVKFQHDEKDALLVYRTNLENEKMITLANLRFTRVDNSWKIAGGMFSTTFEAVSEADDKKAIAKALAEEPKFQLLIPEEKIEPETPTGEIDVQVRAGTYGSFIENGVEMEIKSVVPLWNPESKELTFTLWPFEPTSEEIEYIQWGVGSLFWKTDRPAPDPGQWPGGWPYGKYTISWSMNEESIGDHSKAWTHIYTYGISKQNNNINLSSNQYPGTLKGVVKVGDEIELIAKGEDDISDTTLAWTIKFRGTLLQAMSKDALPPSGNYTVIEGLGDKYTGDWLDGKKHGQGTFIERDGDQYSGEWRNDKKHGRGTYTWSNGRKYSGEWQDDNINGQGVLVEADGGTYDGQWQNGRPHGQGTLLDSSGRKYAGTWKDGKKDGQFEFTDSSGKVLTLTFQNDKQVKEQTPAQKAYEGDKKLVTQFPLNLFETASAASQVLDVLPAKETLDIIQAQGRWVNVKRLSGEQGWLYMPTTVEIDKFNTSIKLGQMDAVKEYLDKGMPMYLAYGPNLFHALHIALMLNQYEVVNILVNRGADVNVRNSMDDTPLQAITKSCGVKKPELVQLLIDAGADVNAQTKSKHSDDIWTPIYWVEMNLANTELGSDAWQNCNKIKDILLSAGAGEANTSN